MEMKGLLRKRYGIRRKNLYNSIYDLPIYNWFKMRSKNDFSYLIKNKKYHGKELHLETKIQLKDIYLDLLTEFFNEFGISKSFKDEVKIKGEIIDKNIEFTNTGDTFIMNDLDILNQKLLKKQADNIDKSMKLSDKLSNKIEIAKVERLLGKIIEIKKISVLSFYTQLISEQVALN